jgi:hypothetical protein
VTIRKRRTSTKGSLGKEVNLIRSLAPVSASSDKLKTQKDTHVSKSRNEITKVINKSIEAQMMQRAKTG